MPPPSPAASPTTVPNSQQPPPTYFQTWYQNLRRAGLCITCRQPSPKHVHCRPCRIARNRADQARYTPRSKTKPTRLPAN